MGFRLVNASLTGLAVEALKTVAVGTMRIRLGRFLVFVLLFTRAAFVRAFDGKFAPGATFGNRHAVAINKRTNSLQVASETHVEISSI